MPLMQSEVVNKLSFKALNELISDICFLLPSTILQFINFLLEFEYLTAIIALLVGLFILIAGFKFKKYVTGAMLFTFSTVYGFETISWLVPSFKSNFWLLIVVGIVFGAAITALYYSWDGFTDVLKYFYFGNAIFMVLMMLFSLFSGHMRASLPWL